MITDRNGVTNALPVIQSLVQDVKGSFQMMDQIKVRKLQHQFQDKLCHMLICILKFQHLKHTLIQVKHHQSQTTVCM